MFTADVPFADTSAADLAFSRGAGRLPAICSTTVPLGGNRMLELVVIGSSHQVIVSENGTDVFVETLACLPPVGSRHQPGAPVAEAPFREHIGPGPEGWGRHSFVAGVDHPAADEFLAQVERIVRAAEAAPYSAIAAFPGEEGAVTALALDTDPAPTGAPLRWRTWHCYPQHSEIVYSASTLGAATAAVPPATPDGSGVVLRSAAAHHVLEASA
ncbi:DUF2617 family protein [Brevibacterium samyangense]|uniref:DUF2617 family protein n=1 Tax=Brevibacterium samyangense TaxID=366888 RepID=A0ABN2T5Z1_9MICO